MEHQELEWSFEQTSFYGQYWKPAEYNKILVLVHGMGEHSGRYGEFVVPFLTDAGIAVFAFDHFGHGKTKGKRGHCPSYEAVLKSVEKAIELSKEHLGDLPIVLYGHSMGGNVVANFVEQARKPLLGAVISSPMLRLAFNPPAWKLAAGKIMKNIYPAFQESSGLDPKAISKDQDAVKKYINDPLVHDKVTVNFTLPFFEAGENAIENAASIHTPCLVVHGTGDQITDHKASKSFAEKNPKYISIHLYEDGFHELHNDPNKNEVLDDITKWISAL